MQYSSARIRNPDRIFFDIHAARLTPEVAKASVHVEGDLLTAVRVAQNHAGIVRVVLDVNGVKDYTASLQDNPPELVIDLYPDRAPARTAKAKHGPTQSDGDAGRMWRPATTAREAGHAATLQREGCGGSQRTRVSDVRSSVGTRLALLPDERLRQLAAAESQPPTAGTRLLRVGADRTAANRVESRRIGTKPDLIQPPSAPAADAGRAIDADAGAGIEDWAHRDRCGARRARHRDDRADRVDGEGSCAWMWRCGWGRSFSSGCRARTWFIRGRTIRLFRWKSARILRMRRRPICLFRFTRIRATTMRRAGLRLTT